MKSFSTEGPVISVSLSSGGKRRRRQLHLLRIEVEMCPFRARERPLVFLARDELLAGMADVEQYAGLLVPAVVDALQEAIEEALLQLHPVVGVEGRPVRAAVDFEPFLSGSRAHEAFEVAARMQSLPAPVRRREQRHLDLRKIGGALPVIRPVERARENLRPHVLPIFRELLRGQRFRTADELAGDAALRAALALAVLHRLHLHLLPVLAEAADDAAVAVAVAVAVAPAFPNADRREVRRLR